MKTWMLATLVALALTATATPTVAQDEGTVVQGLVVTALDHGPAWWKVTKGESTVFILGAPMGMMPQGLKWDEKVLERHMNHAKALISPSGATIGLGDIFGLFKLRGQMKGDAALESALPEPYRSRFIKARNALDKPAGRYANWGPVWAGGMLQRDYAGKYDFEGQGQVSNRVRHYARRFDVDTQRETYKAMPMFKSIVGEAADEDKALTCLSGYLETVETDPARFRAAAKAWADGDVRGAIDVPRGSAVCQAMFADNFVRNSIRDQVAGIEKALETPGKAVAYVPMRRLVLKDGVIEQLRAHGYTVLDPATRQGDDD